MLPRQPTNQINAAEQSQASKELAWIAFADIAIFFGVLLVGFAYLWKRGDLDWVRSVAAQSELPTNNQPVSGEVLRASCRMNVSESCRAGRGFARPAGAAARFAAGLAKPSTRPTLWQVLEGKLVRTCIAGRWT